MMEAMNPAPYKVTVLSPWRSPKLAEKSRVGKGSIYPLSTVSVALPQKLYHFQHYPGGGTFSTNSVRCCSSLLLVPSSQEPKVPLGLQKGSHQSPHLSLLFPSSTSHLKPFSFSCPLNLTFSWLQLLGSLFSICKLRKCSGDNGLLQ